MNMLNFGFTVIVKYIVIDATLILAKFLFESKQSVIVSILRIFTVLVFVTGTLIDIIEYVVGWDCQVLVFVKR